MSRIVELNHIFAIGECQLGADEVLVVIFGTTKAAEAEVVVAIKSILVFIDTETVIVGGVGTDHTPATNTVLKVLGVRKYVDITAGIDLDNKGVLRVALAIAGHNADGVETVFSESVSQCVTVGADCDTVDSPLKAVCIGSIGNEGGGSSILNLCRTNEGHLRGSEITNLNVIENDNIAALAVEVTEGNLNVAADSAGDNSHALGVIIHASKALFEEKGGISAANDIDTIVVASIVGH